MIRLTNIILLLFVLLTSLAKADVKIKLVEVGENKTVKELEWPSHLEWEFAKKLQDSSAKLLIAKVKIEIPSEIKVSSVEARFRSESSLEESSSKQILILSLQRKTERLTLKTENGIMQIGVGLQIQTPYVQADRSCEDQNLMLSTGTGGDGKYFLGMYCEKSKNSFRVILSANEEAQWRGSSLHETSGKGERWKVYDINPDAFKISSGKRIGNFRLQGSKDIVNHWLEFIQIPTDLDDIKRLSANVEVGLRSTNLQGWTEDVSKVSLHNHIEAFVRLFRSFPLVMGVDFDAKAPLLLATASEEIGENGASYILGIKDIWRKRHEYMFAVSYYYWEAMAYKNNRYFFLNSSVPVLRVMYNHDLSHYGKIGLSVSYVPSSFSEDVKKAQQVTLFYTPPIFDGRYYIGTSFRTFEIASGASNYVFSQKTFSIGVRL